MGQYPFGFVIRLTEKFSQELLTLRGRDENILFTPLENFVIYGRGDIDRISIHYRKGVVKAPASLCEAGEAPCFLTGFTQSLF